MIAILRCCDCASDFPIGHPNEITSCTGYLHGSLVITFATLNIGTYLFHQFRI